MCPGGSRSREAEARPVSAGAFRLQRPRLWGLTFIPAELAASFCPRFTRRRRPLACSALSQCLSWSPARQPHAGLTQVGLGTGPPCLPCPGPIIAPVSSPAPRGCWMWPRTPDGMSRAGPQPPCLTPPGSSDPAFRPPCVQRPEQATQLCLAAHVSQRTPHHTTHRASRLRLGHWPLPAFQPLSQVPRPPCQLGAALDAPPSASLLRLSLTAAPGLLGPSRQRPLRPHSLRPALPIAGAHKGPRPPRSPCLSPDLVRIAGDSRLAAVQGPVPSQPSGLRGAMLLPEALTSPDTHCRPVVLTADEDVSR